MSVATRVARSAVEFAGNRAGNAALMFSLSALLLFGSAGAAVDYSRWMSARNKVAAALDSAVLAAGRTIQISGTSDVATAIPVAEQYFAKLKPGWVPASSTTFVLGDGNTVIRGETSTTIPTPFMHIFGVPAMNIKAVAEAVLAAGAGAETDIEVSMMLDITGSMGSGQKLQDMKDAAKDLIDKVVWADQSQHTSRVAIAPFSRRVNAGSYTSTMTGLPSTEVVGSNTKYLIGCVTEREGAEAFTDAAPGGGAYLRSYKGNNDSNDSYNYSTSGLCDEPDAGGEIVPLSANKTMLKSRIDAFVANAPTAGQLGAAMAWYLISPRWDSVWPTSSKPAPYSDLTTPGPSGKPKLKKFVVLMTDGIFNTYGAHNYGDTSSMATTVANNTVALCNGMKAAGIIVFAVGFDLGSMQLPIDTLKACASREPNDPADSPSYFYNSASGVELKAAFADIGLKIATLRLRK